MKFSKSLIFLILIYELNYCKSENENNLIKHLLKEFKVQHCIIVDDFNENITSKDVKYFAKENIYTTAMSIKLFVNYLQLGEYVNAKTAIIIKTNGMIEVLKSDWLKVS